MKYDINNLSKKQKLHLVILLSKHVMDKFIENPGFATLVKSNEHRIEKILHWANSWLTGEDQSRQLAYSASVNAENLFQSTSEQIYSIMYTVINAASIAESMNGEEGYSEFEEDIQYSIDHFLKAIPDADLNSFIQKAQEINS